MFLWSDDVECLDALYTLMCGACTLSPPSLAVSFSIAKTSNFILDGLTILGLLPSDLHDDPLVDLGHLACLVVEVEPHRLATVLVFEAEVVRIAPALQREERLDVVQGDVRYVLGDREGVGGREIVQVLGHVVVDERELLLLLLLHFQIIISPLTILTWGFGVLGFWGDRKSVV